MLYANGRIPESAMVTLATGRDQYGVWKHMLPRGTNARWQWMVADGKRKYGATLRITPGWNAYRPYRIQEMYRHELGIWAAVPGYSSHGGTYHGSQCMAIDVQNWRDLAPGNESLAWSRFKALCRRAGFRVDFVTPREQWHIADFGDIWVIPSWLSGALATVTPGTPVIPEPEPEPDLSEEDIMIRAKSSYTGHWYVIPELAPPTRILAGKNGSESHKRAKAYSNAVGRNFPVLSSAEVQSLLDDNKTRRVAFFRALGLEKQVDAVIKEISDLIDGEK